MLFIVFFFYVWYRLTYNWLCIDCSSPCKTCAGAEDQCLSCTKGFASSGKCVNSCPKGTFSSNGTCANCHPDCGTCKGSSFNECLSCFPHLPALLSGRCLATCNANQFLNPTTSKCQNCDVSCSSCTGSGTDQCLACASPFFIVVNGTCSPVPVLLPASAFLSPAANRSSTKTWPRCIRPNLIYFHTLVSQIWPCQKMNNVVWNVNASLKGTMAWIETRRPYPIWSLKKTSLFLDADWYQWSTIEILSNRPCV